MVLLLFTLLLQLFAAFLMWNVILVTYNAPLQIEVTNGLSCLREVGMGSTDFVAGLLAFKKRCGLATFRYFFDSLPFHHVHFQLFQELC